ncbi:shugoshin 1 [Erythrolamprus reginae]|uniref:shugoshin 1 n=1 Tax=Erythrolamprus reginae TaxID=121349 RepID=UPI00396CBB50
MEKTSKKSFKDSLEDIKERMKEKRNKKWAKLGKANQVLPINSKIADNSVAQLKNFQANNRALALALEEERSKMKEAQDIILCLKREYQSLKFQNFDLQRKLKLQQEKQHAENAIQYNSEHEECDSGSLKKPDSLAFLRHILAVEVGKEDADEIQDKLENTASVSQTDTDYQNYSCGDHHDHANSGSRIISIDEDMQTDYSIPFSISTHRRYLKINSLSEVFESDDVIPVISSDLSCSKNNNENSEEISISQENKHSVNIDKCESDMQIESDKNESYIQIEMATACSEQSNFNNAGGFKIKERKDQKRKLVTPQNVPKARSNKNKNCNKHAGSKQKASTSIHSNDAYDFISEESVHITPFRQNKQNEHVDDKTYTKGEISSSESSVSEEDPDDSLYVPYSKKSKSIEALNTGTDVIPLRTKSRSKKIVSQQHDINPEGENRNTKTLESHLNESSETLQKHHLSDITNVASTSYQTISYPASSSAGNVATHQRRRNTSHVSYKEPSLRGKLRRGDPFTDTSLLNSPVFKERKYTKSKSLSRYNEAFVGY